MYRRALLLIVFSLAAIAEAEDAIVATAKCAPAGKAEGLVLLGEDAHTFSGWSHISAGVPGLAGLRQAIPEYALDLSPQADAGCAEAPVVNALLVKKYHNWHQQHLSGLEAAFPDGAVALGRVDEVVLVLKINGNGTFVPTAELYREAYGDLLTPEQLAELDDQQVTLELTLFDANHANHADQSIPSLNGTYYLSLNQAEVADQWLKVTVPIAAFDFYFQENWEETSVAREEQLQQKLVGLRINPETRSGKVVRNYLLDKYSGAAPKLFKEIDLSLSHAAIHLK